MSTIQHDAPKYHIQPYCMNGLNWRLVPDDPDRDDIVVVRFWEAGPLLSDERSKVLVVDLSAVDDMELRAFSTRPALLQQH